MWACLLRLFLREFCSRDSTRIFGKVGVLTHITRPCRFDRGPRQTSSALWSTMARAFSRSLPRCEP